ncbi:MAG TPA: hypothetical protein VG986_15510 [Pseudolabrys sp.]|nr:hypothetical protein [Pseudolabrys sp.]
MENAVSGLVVLVGIFIVLFVIAFFWELGRRTYYWTAAKLFRWSKEERFQRETAWLDRAAANAQRRAEKDARATADTYRRGTGVTIVTFAIAALAFQIGLPWWHTGAIILATYIGLTMAAGLAFVWSRD